MSRPATIQEFLNRSGPPRVIAHRGFSGAAPENTMPAFRLALGAQADMIELDVLLSRDGEVVVFHDETLDRTTDGSGLVADHTYEELRALDAGIKFGHKFAGERIPTLAKVLDYARGRILLNIEIKGEAVTDQVQGGIESKVLELVEGRGMLDEVIISSFQPRALRHCRSLSKEVVLAALFDSDHQLADPAAITARTGARGFNLAANEVSPIIMELAHAAGLFVSVYTVDDPTAMRYILGLGVDALFTNQPSIMREVVNSLEDPGRGDGTNGTDETDVL